MKKYLARAYLFLFKVETEIFRDFAGLYINARMRTRLGRLYYTTTFGGDSRVPESILKSQNGPVRGNTWRRELLSSTE